ncbi:MAG: hypothetical protein SOU03_09300, partial [Dorea sp.]|nr:hypothetical protein [Dorea sp.]
NVTSFSASLLQSLSGDTKAAAEVADMAMTDMSDNANKMGTSMELIQNAYQGFAKQNYTMLDNLKLGYGGTKTEMERLLSDAQKLTGVKYDINNLSDVYNAIHAIQENLGITGTTAKEAASTIEGSMNAAKAAWDNFLNGTISAEEFADTISIAVENIAKNLGEIVPRLASTIPEVVKNLYEMIASSFEQNSGGIAQAGMDLLDNFTSGLIEAAPNVTDRAGEIVSNLMNGIQEAAPQMLTSAVEVIASFAQGIGAQLPTLVPQALNMIVTLAGALISNIPTIVQAGVSVLGGLAQGLVNAIPVLINKAPVIIGQLASAIIQSLPKILQAGVNILVTLADGLVSAIPKLLSKIPSIITEIKNAFTSVDWASVGMNIIRGIASGISGAVETLVEAAANAATDALNWVKEKLGIHSPSTVFRDQVGKYMALGIGVGFEDNIPVDDINESLEKAINNIDSDSIEVKLGTMMKSLQGKAVDSVSISSSNATEATAIRSRSDNNNPGIDYNRLGKEMSKRPINVSAKFMGREMIKMSAAPMQRQIKKNEALQSMLKGERVWDYQ